MGRENTSLPSRATFQSGTSKRKLPSLVFQVGVWQFFVFAMRSEFVPLELVFVCACIIRYWRTEAQNGGKRSRAPQHSTSSE
jgi:hypothetical protein